MKYYHTKGLTEKIIKSCYFGQSFSNNIIPIYLSILSILNNINLNILKDTH